jgi:hypothetical protein
LDGLDDGKNFIGIGSSGCICVLELAGNGFVTLKETVNTAGVTLGCSFLISSDALKGSLDTCCQFTDASSGTSGDLEISYPADGKVCIGVEGRSNAEFGIGNIQLNLVTRVSAPIRAIGAGATRFL